MDGTVDMFDLNHVLTDFGENDATWSDGDFNGDGKVDASDFSMLLANFGTVVCRFFDVGTSASVPEPGTLVLLSLGVLSLLICRRRVAG